MKGILEFILSANIVFAAVFAISLGAVALFHILRKQR